MKRLRSSRHRVISGFLLFLPVLALTPSFLPAAPAAAPALTGFPFTNEDLNYSVNWPSGISLGDAHLHAKRSGADWNFSLTLDAGVPGYKVKDSYRSETVADLCSASFERTMSHGARATDERETIDRSRATATRQTLSKEGGKSDISVPGCIRDALTYLFYARREMGQGRVPAAQSFLFGNLYSIRADYAGAVNITMKGHEVQTDLLTCTVRAGISEYKIDVYFARDAARTPLRISTPLAMGKFSMELVR